MHPSNPLVTSLGSQQSPPQVLGMTEDTDRASHIDKFGELFGRAPSNPAVAYRDFLFPRLKRMWAFINWAKARTTFLEQSLRGSQKRCEDLEAAVEGATSSQGSVAPIRPGTSSSVAGARAIFAIDNDSLAGTITSDITRLPQDMASKICESYRKEGARSRAA